MKVVLTPHAFTQMTGKETTEPKSLEELIDEWFPPGTLERDDAERAWRVMRRRAAVAEALTGWLGRIPILGYLARVFWYCIIDEGIVATCKPRWGALTFSFLNDGVGPTFWHTSRSVLNHRDYGLYNRNPVDGARRAPRSQREADLWGGLWREERRRREEEATGI